MYGKLCRYNFGFNNYLFTTEVPPQLRKSFYNFSDNLVVLPELIYQGHKDLVKYKNSHILVLGGGPSTDSLNWNTLAEDYEYIWSMNHAFFHPKLKEIGVDLLTIGCSVDILGPEITEFINKYNPITAFELHVKYYGQDDTDQHIREANEKFYDNNHKICYQTKFYSQLGTGARQLILAASLAPAKISFIGFDGPKAIYNKEHAFAKKDKEWTSQHQLPGTLKPYPRDYVFQHFAHEYKVFWQYMKQLFPNVEFDSIDKENKYHECGP